MCVSKSDTSMQTVHMYRSPVLNGSSANGNLVNASLTNESILNEVYDSNTVLPARQCGVTDS